MKQIVIILCIIVAVAVGVFFEQKTIKQTFDELGEKTLSCIDKEKNEVSEIAVTEVYAWWKEKKRTLHAIIPHNDIKELESHFSLAKIYSSEKNNIDALCELEAILDLAVSIPKTYKFAIENLM